MGVIGKCNFFALFFLSLPFSYFSSTFFCKLNIDSCTSNIIVGFSLVIGGVILSTLMDKVSYPVK